MGYEFHITRADLHWESPQYPISREEWREADRRHPEVEIAPHPDPGAGSFSGPDGDGGWFIWQSGQITTRFGRGWTPWMVHFAQELSARLVGDDNEEYLEDGTEVPWTGARPPVSSRPLKPDEAAAAMESLIDKHTDCVATWSPAQLRLTDVLRGFEAFAAREIETTAESGADMLLLECDAREIDGMPYARVGMVRQLAVSDSDKDRSADRLRVECELLYPWPANRDPLQRHARDWPFPCSPSASPNALNSWFREIEGLNSFRRLADLAPASIQFKIY